MIDKSWRPNFFVLNTQIDTPAIVFGYYAYEVTKIAVIKLFLLGVKFNLNIKC